MLYILSLNHLFDSKSSLVEYPNNFNSMIMLFSVFIENFMISPFLNCVLYRSLPFDPVSRSIFPTLLLLSGIDCDTSCEVY